MRRSLHFSPLLVCCALACGTPSRSEQPVVEPATTRARGEPREREPSSAAIPPSARWAGLEPHAPSDFDAMLRASAADPELPRLVQGDHSPFDGPPGIRIALAEPPPPEQAWLAQAFADPLMTGRARCPEDRPAVLRDGAPFTALGTTPTRIVDCVLVDDETGRYAVLHLADQRASLALARPGTSFPGTLVLATISPRPPEFYAPLSAANVTYDTIRLPAPAAGIAHAMLDLPGCRPDCVAGVSRSPATAACRRGSRASK